jgi:hypothetical protein
MRPNLNLPLLLIIIFALVSGIILRVASFRWNYRIQGDVNLFALSAREFVLHNRLYYPMKYDYGNVTRYAELQSPASQHPPLWPFMAGLLAKLLSTNETFFTLKLLSEFTGLLLIAVVAYFGIRAGRVIEALFSIAGIAVSPILIDYSANGSMYILSALLIILTVILLRYFDHQNLWHYVTAGVLCGVGLEVHSALVSLILAFFLFGFWERSNLRWSGVSIYVLAALLTVTPWLAWNWINLGKLCYTSSPGYLLQKLGLVNIGLNNGGITEVMTGVLDKNTLKLYVYLFFAGVVGFLNGYITEIGPFCLFLAMVGFSQLISSRRRDLSVVLPYVAYIFVIFLWASYKYRFLVPALPAAYLASSIGFVTLYNHWC